MTEKIIIIENSTLFANALELIIENVFHKKVAAKLNFDDDLLEVFQDGTPNIALIDFDSTNSGDVRKIAGLMELFPKTLYIAMCNRKENNHLDFVKNHGFNGFVTKVNFIKDFQATIDSIETVNVC